MLNLLQQRSVRLRECRAVFSLASGVVRAGGAARLTVRWDGRMRRCRFIHLPGLSVPVILGRDFLRKSRITIDIANGGYRAGPVAPLVPFVSPPAAALACAGEASPSCGVLRTGESPGAPQGCSAAFRLKNEAARKDAFHPLIADVVGWDRKEKARISDILFRFAELFTDLPGCTDLVRHTIETGNALPLKCYPRPTSLAKRRAIDGALDELLATNVVRRSDSPWASPVVPVEKKDGSFRLCVDYRRLNALTRKDAYPLPTIESIVGNLGSARYFTILDASKGYLQVEMDREDQAKTAFTCHRGLFEFTRMPFGLCNAPATFQRLMDRVLGDSRWSHAMCYLDDIVIYSRSLEEHASHLEDVLGRLKAAGITLNPAKAQIARTQVQLLGFTLGGGSIEPNAEKLQAILDFPTPTEVRGLRRFLGMANFYRSFIPSCARLQAPLSRLLGKSVEWHWGPEQEHAFRSLSRAIAETAQLRLPDLNREFVVQTDASDLGLGAVLLQEYDGVLHPLAFASRSLLPAEKNYSVTERECLAIVFALRKFDVYLDGTKFVVQTDHSALTWLMRLREPSGRLARWALLIQHYDFSVQYRKGSSNVVADALSRAPLSLPASAERDVSPDNAGEQAAAAEPDVGPPRTAARENTVGASSPPVASVAGSSAVEASASRAPKGKLVCVTPRAEKGERAAVALCAEAGPSRGDASDARAPKGPPRTGQAQATTPEIQACAWTPFGIIFSREELIQAQQDDPFCRDILGRLREAERRDVAGFATGAEGPEPACIAGSPEDTYLLDKDELVLKYVATDDESVNPFKVVIPKRLRCALLRYAHDEPLAGHLSGSKVFSKISRTVTWPGMRRDIFRYCRSCHACQSVKARGGRPPGLMKPIDSQRPWQIAACDLMGPFPRSKHGYQHLLVVVDHFTKWVELFPLRKVTARAVLDKLMEVFTRFGFPERLITDNASYFTARIFRETCSSLRIEHRPTSPYHPQSNLTERFNRSVKTMLRAFAASQKDWADHLNELAFAIRTAESRSTGFSPAFLTFGRHLANPLTIVTQRQEADESAHPDHSSYASQLCARLHLAFDKARKSLGVARAQQKAQYDKSHRNVCYQAGDFVLKRNHALSDASKGFSAALAPKWVGPYQVERRLSPLVYELKHPQTGKTSGRVHVADLKAYNCRPAELEPGYDDPAPGQPSTPGVLGRFRPPHRYNLRRRSLLGGRLA